MFRECSFTSAACAWRFIRIVAGTRFRPHVWGMFFHDFVAMTEEYKTLLAFSSLCLGNVLSPESEFLPTIAEIRKRGFRPYV